MDSRTVVRVEAGPTGMRLDEGDSPVCCLLTRPICTSTARSGGWSTMKGAPVERVRLATRAALENLVRLCLEERVDFLVIAGDLFDYDWRDFNTALFVVKQFQLLERAEHSRIPDPRQPRFSGRDEPQGAVAAERDAVRP